MADVISDSITALGMLVVGDFVSSAKSAAASKPVSPHAPKRSERANDEKCIDFSPIVLVADSRFSNEAFPLMIQMTDSTTMMSTTPIRKY